MNNIKKFRLEQNITLEKLSKETGISIGYLCHLEKGTRNNPTLKIMKTISSTLHKTIDEVFCLV